MAKRIIILKSSDGEVFEVDELVAMQSETIKLMIEAENGIPLHNVTSETLSKVIEYCKKHVDQAAASNEDLRSWDAEFMRVNDAILFDLILAAYYLAIRGLLDLTCQAVADKIKGKTPQEIRETFNMQNEFTPEEVEEVRREYPWAFQ